MSRRYPAVTGIHVLRALRKAGWYVDHVNGSHHQLVHVTSGKYVTVPIHSGRIVKRKTLNTILELTNLSVDDFRKLL